MRTPLAVLFAAFAGVAATQTLPNSSGTYESSNWSVDSSHCLVWDGAPYTPVGAVVDATPSAIAAAKAAGIGDVLVDVPAGRTGWPEALDALAKADLRYLLRINSLAPLARGIVVDPQGYRVPNITEPKTLTLRIPGATSALVLLAATRDGYVESVQRVRLEQGTLIYEAKPKSNLDHVALIYPLVDGLELPDFWEGFDEQRDTLLATLRTSKLGKGLRGIVNPMGRTLALPGNRLQFVPTSSAFQLELAALMESRYRNVETAQRSWSMSGSAFSTTDDEKKPLTTFNDLARLVPLWSGNRGIGQLWDPTTDKLYQVDQKKSTVWRDISDAVSDAGKRRFDRLVAAVRGIANVPVVQEWAGWSAPYEASAPALSGVGMRASGTSPTAIVNSGCRAVSSVARWSVPGWLIATTATFGADPATVAPGIGDVLSLGAKGVFVEARSDAMLKAVAAESGRAAAMAAYQATPVFFPENAMNPAQPQRLPGGRWWLPTPSDGNRINLGNQYFAYRMRLGNVTSFALWGTSPARVRLRMTNPKAGTFMTVDGSDAMVKMQKDGVDVNLTEFPLLITDIDEIPVPQPAYEDLVIKFNELMKLADTAKRDASEERIIFNRVLPGFDRNPGGTFPVLLDQYYRASQRLGAFTWIEAESPRDTNFSEVSGVPASSNGSVLTLRTPIPPDRAYFAEYTIPVRTGDEQEVWLAARIPLEQRRNVQITIGGQTLTLQGDPVGLYGDGYGWYRLGPTRLAGAESRMRVVVIAPEGSDLSLDAILLTPTQFVPRGVMPPDVLTIRR